MNAPARFAVRFADEDMDKGGKEVFCGNEADVTRALEEYRGRHPGTLFAQVSIHEMRPESGQTMGAPRSVHDFIQ